MDHKKLAVIHIVKKELGLTDEEYRTILKTVAGVESSRDLDDAGFRKLMNYLVRSKHYRINAYGLTLKQKLFVRHLARELGWDEGHLNNFIRKYYHKDQLDALSRKEAMKLIESLKNVLGHRPGEDGNVKFPRAVTESKGFRSGEEDEAS